MVISSNKAWIAELRGRTIKVLRQLEHNIRDAREKGGTTYRVKLCTGVKVHPPIDRIAEVAKELLESYLVRLPVMFVGLLLSQFMS